MGDIQLETTAIRWMLHPRHDTQVPMTEMLATVREHQMPQKYFSNLCNKPH